MRKLVFPICLILIMTVLLISGCGGGSSSGNEGGLPTASLSPSPSAPIDNLTVTWPNADYIAGFIPIKSVFSAPNGVQITQVQFIVGNEVVKSLADPNAEFIWDASKYADGDYLCKFVVTTSSGPFSAEKTLRIRQNMANIKMVCDINNTNKFSATFANTTTIKNVALVTEDGSFAIGKTSDVVYSSLPNGFVPLLPGKTATVKVVGQNNLETEVKLSIPDKLRNVTMSDFSKWVNKVQPLAITWNSVTIPDLSKIYGIFVLNGTYDYLDYNWGVPSWKGGTWNSNSITLNSTQNQISLPVDLSYDKNYLNGGGTKEDISGPLGIAYTLYTETNRVYGCYYNSDASTKKFDVTVVVETAGRTQ